MPHLKAPALLLQTALLGLLEAAVVEYALVLLLLPDFLRLVERLRARETPGQAYCACSARTRVHGARRGGVAGLQVHHHIVVAVAAVVI